MAINLFLHDLWLNSWAKGDTALIKELQSSLVRHCPLRCFQISRCQKTFQKCNSDIALVIMTWLFKIIHTPYWKQFHVGNIFFSSELHPSTVWPEGRILRFFYNIYLPQTARRVQCRSIILERRQTFIWLISSTLSRINSLDW